MAKRPAKPTDVIIIGTSPAACVAALRVRSLQREVVLIEPPLAEAPAGSLAWLNAEGIKFAGQCGLKPALLSAERFTGLSLYSADLRRHSHVDRKELCGALVDLRVLQRALMAAAVESGITHVRGAVSELSLAETSVRYRLETGASGDGQIVLIDDGVQSSTAGMVRLAAAGQVASVPSCISATFRMPEGQAALSVILGIGKGANMGFIARSGRSLHFALVVRDSGPLSRGQFDQFRVIAENAGLIPSKQKPECACRPSPAGVALDMDSHVGKRSLLIGEAGGFVAAFNHDALYPAMRSGWIAAETACRALKAPLLQDELVTFEGAWRTELSDYLRMPNTDLSLLMPLVFNDNLQMSHRVARAFLLGDRI